MAVTVQSCCPKQAHKFPSRRYARDGGLLSCFMVPRQAKRDAASAPLLDPDTGATDSDSFVFSPVALSSAPDLQVLESPSFRTLSDPLPSAVSYSSCEVCANLSGVTTSKFGGRPHPLPPLCASPFQKLGPAAKPVWLPLPVPNSCSTLLSSTTNSSSSASSEGSSTVHSASELQAGGVGSWSIRRGKVAPAGALPLPPACVATQLLPGLESFAFEDLARGTRDFAPDACMEKGEFGALYRACVKLHHLPAERSSLREFAVVRLNVDESKSLKDWKADVEILSQLSDSNICVIKGYCAREGDGAGEYHDVSSERLLVFDQSPNGTLHDYLCGSREKTQLDWAARISIVLGAARGLLYVHDRAPFQVVYREFKSSSVLLDKDYTPRLAGYGLAVTTPLQPSPVTSMKSRHVAHAKRNVWSFGLVLVELLTGKSTSTDPAFQCDEQRFVQWAMPFLRNESKLVRVLDPRVKGKCSVTGALKVAELAARCLKKKAVKRPNMATVVDSLRSIKDNFGDRALILQSRVPSFGHVSFRDPELIRSNVGLVDPKLHLSMSSMSASSEDEYSSASSNIANYQAIV